MIKQLSLDSMSKKELSDVKFQLEQTFPDVEKYYKNAKFQFETQKKFMLKINNLLTKRNLK